MQIWKERLSLPRELFEVLEHSLGVVVPESKEHLYDLIFNGEESDEIQVTYQVNGRTVKEAEVTRCRNGAVVNYMEDYMRRRDPDSMRIADERPTDKPRFADVYGYPFRDLRTETMTWMEKQELILVPFWAGGRDYGYEALLLCPRNAAFFAFSLAQLQAFVDLKETEEFTPRAIIYVAPPFRHTHFEGKQVVVHNRSQDLHEIFSYNFSEYHNTSFRQLPLISQF